MSTQYKYKLYWHFTLLYMFKYCECVAFFPHYLSPSPLSCPSSLARFRKSFLSIQIRLFALYGFSFPASFLSYENYIHMQPVYIPGWSSVCIAACAPAVQFSLLLLFAHHFTHVRMIFITFARINFELIGLCWHLHGYYLHAIEMNRCLYNNINNIIPTKKKGEKDSAIVGVRGVCVSRTQTHRAYVRNRARSRVEQGKKCNSLPWIMLSPYSLILGYCCHYVAYSMWLVHAKYALEC